MPPAQFLVRPLQEDDAPAYRSLRLRALSDHPSAFTSSLGEERAKPLEWSTNRLKQPNTRFWGAFCGPELVGMLGLEREPREQSRHKGTLVGMYVAPECAGQGLARKLLAALLSAAKSENLRLVVLTVTRGNEPARALYASAGFQTFGEEPQAVCVNGVFLDKIHMYLLL